MAKHFTLQTVADTDYLQVYPNLTEEEFKRFKEDPSEFEYEDRITFLMEGNLRTAEVTTDDDETIEIDPDELWSNYLTPYDSEAYYDENTDSDDPVKKVLCEKILKNIDSSYKCLTELKPNTVTVISKWHVYKEIDDFAFELEDDEEFDVERIQLIIEDYGKPRLPIADCPSSCDDVFPYLSKIDGKELYWDIFLEDRYSMFSTAYNYKQMELVCNEDCGADAEAWYAIRTDANGKVISIEEFEM